MSPSEFDDHREYARRCFAKSLFRQYWQYFLVYMDAQLQTKWAAVAEQIELDDAQRWRIENEHSVPSVDTLMLILAAYDIDFGHLVQRLDFPDRLVAIRAASMATIAALRDRLCPGNQAMAHPIEGHQFDCVLTCWGLGYIDTLLGIGDKNKDQVIQEAFDLLAVRHPRKIPDRDEVLRILDIWFEPCLVFYEVMPYIEGI